MRLPVQTQIPVGCTRVMVKCMIMSVASEEHWEVIIKQLIAIDLCGLKEISIAAVFNVISTAYRRGNTTLEGDPLSIEVVNCICGRAWMKSDWELEKADRTGEGAVIDMKLPSHLPNSINFEARLDDELMDMCSHLFRHTSDSELAYSWLSHIKESPDWLTSDSPGMVKVTTPDGSKVRASNKRIVVESLTISTLLELRNQPARLMATGSEK